MIPVCTPRLPVKKPPMEKSPAEEFPMRCDNYFKSEP